MSEVPLQREGPRGPLGPLGFERAQHRQTLRPTVDGTRTAAGRSWSHFPREAPSLLLCREREREFLIDGQPLEAGRARILNVELLRVYESRPAFNLCVKRAHAYP